MRGCTVDACTRAHRARGLCATHYTRARRGGMATIYPIPVEERFWGKVEKTETCWLWNGNTHHTGYGLFVVATTPGKKITVYAHRLGYELERGPIPEGLQIDHLCRVTLCVRPDHLEAVTQRENLRRQWDHIHSKGRVG